MKVENHIYKHEYLFSLCGYWVYRTLQANETLQFELHTPTRSFTDTSTMTCFANLDDLVNYALSNKRGDS